MLTPTVTKNSVWNNLDKSKMTAFRLKFDTTYGDHFEVEWEKCELTLEQWGMLLGFAIQNGPMGSVCPITWKDENDVWHDIENVR